MCRFSNFATKIKVYYSKATKLIASCCCSPLLRYCIKLDCIIIKLILLLLPQSYLVYCGLTQWYIYHKPISKATHMNIDTFKPVYTGILQSVYMKACNSISEYGKEASHVVRSISCSICTHTHTVKDNHTPVAHGSTCT